MNRCLPGAFEVIHYPIYPRLVYLFFYLQLPDVSYRIHYQEKRPVKDFLLRDCGSNKNLVFKACLNFTHNIFYASFTLKLFKLIS